MLSICSQGRWLGLNRSQMSWIPERFPRGPLPITPNTPWNGERQGEPRLSLLFTYFFLEEGGEGAVEVTVGLEPAVGWKTDSQEECAIAYPRPVAPLCRLTFLSSFIADSSGLAPRPGGSAPRLVSWWQKQNPHNTCQLCFLHALWQIFPPNFLFYYCLSGWGGFEVLFKSDFYQSV